MPPSRSSPTPRRRTTPLRSPATAPRSSWSTTATTSGPGSTPCWSGSARGFLREGDRIVVRLGDRSQGSPGYRLQTAREKPFWFKIFVDAFSTYDFVELPNSPTLELVPGPVVRWKAILPTLRARRTAVPSGGGRRGPLGQSQRAGRCDPSPGRRPAGRGPARDPRGARLATARQPSKAFAGASPAICASTFAMRTARGLPAPTRCASWPTPAYGHYWGDLHGQSGETVGTGTAAEYYRFARDKAYLDIVGHQGNDFQIDTAFWAEINRIAAELDEPGRVRRTARLRVVRQHRSGRRSQRVLPRAGPADLSVLARPAGGGPRRGERLPPGRAAVPEARGRGRGGDRPCRRPLRRPSRRPRRPLRARGRGALLLGHLRVAPARRVRPRPSRRRGLPQRRPQGPARRRLARCGPVRRDRRPHLLPDAEARSGNPVRTLRKRHHYGTTGTRLYLDVQARLPDGALLFDDDPKLGPAASAPAARAMMGDMVQAEGEVILQVDALGSAPIERIVVLNGKEPLATVAAIARISSAGASACCSRARNIAVVAARFFGRAMRAWSATASTRAQAINLFNADKPLRLAADGSRVDIDTVTTGNFCGFDLWLADAKAGEIDIVTRRGDDACADRGHRPGGPGRRCRRARPTTSPVSPAGSQRDLGHAVRAAGAPARRETTRSMSASPRRTAIRPGRARFTWPRGETRRWRAAVESWKARSR